MFVWSPVRQSTVDQSSHQSSYTLSILLTFVGRQNAALRSSIFVWSIKEEHFRMDIKSPNVQKLYYHLTAAIQLLSNRLITNVRAELPQPQVL